MKNRKEDSILRELRTVREGIAEQCGYDLEKIAAFIKNGERLPTKNSGTLKKAGV